MISATKIRHLILPSRPDPAQSRQIAEGRLLICCLVALSIFITIGVRIVSLADASADTHLSLKGSDITAERGRILDRKGPFAGWQPPNHRFAC